MLSTEVFVSPLDGLCMPYLVYSISIVLTVKKSDKKSEF